MTDPNNPSSSFVHVHVHTEFSLLDGLSAIDKLVKHAKSMEMPALAITDHGTMFGVMEFYDACKNAGIKPIIGVEAYLAPNRMTDRDPKLDKRPFHMLLLARNRAGYQNLLKITSAAQLEGYYYRPRIDWEFLRDHADGLIATTGCLAAKVPSLIMDGKDDDAFEWIGRFQDLFGPEHFFLELQQHDIPELDTLNRWLVEYRRRGHTPVQMVATNDVHYVLKDDYDAHDTLLCIQTTSLKTDDNRLRMSDNSYYLSSPREIWNYFGEVPEAIHNSLKIAEMCELDLERKGYHLPVFPVPAGHDAGSYLRLLCEKGLDWRFGDRRHDPVVRERLEKELGIIGNMGFNTYFLIVWDLCQYARHADIWFNVRGSGAGSLVAYCLGITSIDPLQNNLLFERFLNPGRVSMPDIDIDFPDDRRGDMIAYCVGKYGEDKVAAIITFGTMGPKAAIKDVGRALNVPLNEVNRATSMIPQEAKQKSIEEYIELNPDLQKYYKENAVIRQVMDTAKILQGVSRHTSIHAAGVIVADQPLVEYLPLHRVSGKDPSGGLLKSVTQFPMETCESIGLLKVDFLGLSTLAIMRKACELIEQHHGIHYTPENIPYRHDDPHLTDSDRALLDDAFALISRGETIGVFQLESTGMQQMLRGMRPREYENIVAAVSLYRPGPMEFIPQYNRRLHGEEQVVYRHKKLEPILKDTYGILIYQEQIMQVASDLFGYELGEADLMRRAVSKKKEKDLAKHRATFLERGPKYGVEEAAANAIFDDIEFFANYGFNRCLTGDTEVIDADTGRMVTIQSLADGEHQLDWTTTCDIDTLKLTRGRVTDVIRNGVKPVYRLRTRSGREIKATANHPFYRFDGWTLLADLRVGDMIAARDEVQHSALDWDEIAAIEYAGREQTFDLSIEETHNFVANGLIVHNSHAADYAFVAIQTAFLKAHYPVEYLTAMLYVWRDDSAKISHFLEEVRRLQIPILPPDVNYSALNFDIQDDPATGRRGIRFGLAAVKNAGEGALRPIIEQREADGPFRDLEAFCRRVDLRQVGKRTLESLAKVGALDALGGRARLVQAVERMVSFSAAHFKDQEVGQMNMFGMAASASESLLADLPDVQEMSEREMLKWEKELLGLYVTGRPVDRYRDALQQGRTLNVADMKERREVFAGKAVAVAGEITTMRKLFTKNGEAMAALNLEDWHSSGAVVEVTIFPRLWKKVQEMIANEDLTSFEAGDVVLINGKVDISRGDAQIIAESVTQNFSVMTAAAGSTARRQQGTPEWAVDPVDPPWVQTPAYAPPPPDQEDFYDEETGEVAQPAPEPEPETVAVVAPATQGAIAVLTPAVEPQLAPARQTVNGQTGSGQTGSGQIAAIKSHVTTPVEPLPVDDFMSDWDKPAPPQRWITVYFPRSGDDDRDRRRLRQLIGLLMQYPGQDRFSVVVEAAVGSKGMEFPNHTTGICAELIRDLLAIVEDEHNISIDHRA